MSKKSRQSRPVPRTPTGDQSLTVWGERRRDPDWDTFIAALLAYALRQVDESTESTDREPRGERG